MHLPPSFSLIILPFIFVASVSQAVEPVLEFDFNTNPGNVITGGGSAQPVGTLEGEAKIGKEGSGLTGKSNDLAFDNTDVQSAESAGRLKLADLPELRGLDQMTVTLWFKPEGGTLRGEGERLIDYGANWLFFADAPRRLSVQIPAGVGQSASNESYAGSGWVFAAFSFNQAENRVIYYKGDLSSPTQQIIARTSFIEPMGNRRTSLQIGNNEACTRAFDGWLDNVKIFDQALSADEIEAIRMSDLAK
jgi:hypothetical protein